MNTNRSTPTQAGDLGPSRSHPLPRAAVPSPGKRPEKCLPTEPASEFKLSGDVGALKDAFVGTSRRLVGTSVPESIYRRMQAYPGGISAFYEDSLAAFDGNLESLVAGAVQFIRDRKRRALTDPLRNANGRIYLELFHRIELILTALKEIKGMSRAKVLAGLIALNIDRLQDPD